MSASRRDFLKQASLASLGFMGLNLFACGGGGEAAAGRSRRLAQGFGPLVSDPNGLFDLPEGFSYRVISRWGDAMDDGLLLPNRADGMASFPGPAGKVLLVRNHEISSDDRASGAFGEGYEHLSRLGADRFYDFGQGTLPALGGTTTVLFDEATQQVERQYLSLAGTIRNCAGGPTPWGSWITCEETVERQGDNHNQRDHGFTFEVPARAEIRPADPIPLTDMGRFNHEAVCVDPRTGIVYQTEDRHDGLIYRFLPHQPGRLQRGGQLQVLALRGAPSTDTRNWPLSLSDRFPVGKAFGAEWLDIDEVLSPKDDLRHRGFQAGAACFARGEGMWFGEGELYFACTNGGPNRKGQVFRYVPSAYEGTPREAEAPGQLTLFIEPNDTELLKNCDNLTVAPWGDLILCEDHDHPNLVGVTPEGAYYRLGSNVGRADSELTGVHFAPSGRTLFVNIQHYGLTLAITGPWPSAVG
mgnify:CR=1 FL=1